MARPKKNNFDYFAFYFAWILIDCIIEMENYAIFWKISYNYRDGSCAHGNLLT